MSYNKIVGWKDRIVQRPLTFNFAENQDGSKTLTPAPGTVTEAGTPVNAANLGAMDEAIQHIGVALDMLETITQALIRKLRKDTDTNTGNIATNTNNISTNTGAISTHTTQISGINTTLRAMRYEVGDVMTIPSGDNVIGVTPGVSDGGNYSLDILIPTSKMFAADINDIEINDDAEIMTVNFDASTQRLKKKINQYSTVHFISATDRGLKFRLVNNDTTDTFCQSAERTLRAKLFDCTITFKHTA